MKAVLLDAISVGGEAVVDRYLHDFTHMAYEPQDEDELEVTIHDVCLFDYLKQNFKYQLLAVELVYVSLKTT